jgi:hypothetical protein
MPFPGGTDDLSQTPESFVTPTGPLEIFISGGHEEILTSGSDLAQAAQSSGNRGLPWPKIINGAIKFFNSFRPNALREIAHENVNGNYGAESSKANYSFRYREFMGVGSMPDIYLRRRVTWNNLTPIVWGLRDLDPSQQAQAGELIAFTGTGQVAPTSFTAAGVASLQEELL